MSGSFHCLHPSGTMHRYALIRVFDNLSNSAPDSNGHVPAEYKALLKIWAMRMTHREANGTAALLRILLRDPTTLRTVAHLAVSSSDIFIAEENMVPRWR